MEDVLHVVERLDREEYAERLGNPISPCAEGAGVSVEDLFVRPAARNRGLGKALLQHLAGIAVERKCARFEWAVLDWNTPAMGFYEALGAAPMKDWTVFRLAGPALTALAAR